MNYVQKLKNENSDLQIRIDGAVEYIEEEIRSKTKYIERMERSGKATFTCCKIAVAKRDAFVAARNKLKS